MAKLGFNILLSVFDLLVQEDKLECMTVCQQWYGIIHTHSLFRNIYIENQTQLGQLIERVERDPAVGEKVEKLILEFPLGSAFDSDVLTELFPNLRYCVLEGISVDQESFIPLEPDQNHTWRKNIEHIKGMELTVKAFLASGICKNLTFISMREEEDKSARDFIKLLANASALKILNINGFTMSLEDFEFLHNTVPLLDSLMLEYVYFDLTSSPLGIVPATSMKSFKGLGLWLDNSGEAIKFLSYFSQKYTHIEELALGWSDTNNITLIGQDMIAIGSYMKILGKKLKSFSFMLESYDVMMSTFDFNVMDAGGCQIEKLELGHAGKISALEQLAETTQAQYIRSITVSGMWDVETMESGSSSFLWLLRFKSLKKLVLVNDYETKISTLNLNDLLENLCETGLEHLKLFDLHLRLNNSYRIPVCSSLKSLTICDSAFDTGIDAFISSACPNIKRLALKFPLGLKESFVFPNLDLSYLEMINSTKDETFPVMVITLDNNRRRLYNARTKKSLFRYGRNYPLENSFLFPSAYCQSFDKSDITSMLTITCHSVYDFNLLVCNRND